MIMGLRIDTEAMQSEFRERTAPALLDEAI